MGRGGGSLRLLVLSSTPSRGNSTLLAQMFTQLFQGIQKMFREEREEGSSHTEMTKSAFTSLRNEGKTKLFQGYLRLTRATETTTQRREVKSTALHLYEAGVV